MQKLKDLIRSPHIQIALTTGISIVVMAYFSKKILPEPIGYLPLAVPPFIASIYEYVAGKNKSKKIAETKYWIFAIVLASALVIIYYAVKSS